MNKSFHLIIGILLTFHVIVAQEKPPAFLNEITAFKRADSTNMPAKKSILLAGSSSFRLWKDVQSYFSDYPILNRGFGGATLKDMIYYAKDIILPYAPKQIFIYCGENDIADDSTVTPAIVFDRFQQLYKIIRGWYKQIPIVYISIKPSISRWRLESKFVKANQLIAAFIKKQKRIQYLDVHSAMLLPDGSPDPSIYIDDKLHMNAKGYNIWKQLMQGLLLK